MRIFYSIVKVCLIFLSVITIFQIQMVDSIQAQVLPGGAQAGRVDNRFSERTAPTVKPKITKGLESTVPPSEAATYKLRLSGVSIEGSTAYNQDNLRPLYADLIGKDISLAQVFAIAAKITARYGQDGYLLSRAIVPPQELTPSGAVIRIKIIEGYVDEVRWPDTLSRYRNFFQSYSVKITADRPLNNRTLERYLLLANDLPGLKFESSLSASTVTQDASVLIVTVTETPVEAYASADNYGVEASGPYEASLGGSINNILGIHERLNGEITLAGPSENDQKELIYFSWRYAQIINSEGLELFFEGNTSRGDPGTTRLLALDFNTKGLNLTAGVSFPFIRTRSENLTGTIAFDFKNSKSEFLSALSTQDRLRIIRGELAYEKADEFGGSNQLTLVLSKGIEGLGSTANGNPLASRTPGVVDFFKVTGEIARTQKLPKRFSVFASLFGQWTDDALLSSQECGFGGRNYGRGFDSSIITGDQCFLANAELRYDINLRGSTARWLEYSQPYAFVDYGKIWNIAPPLGTPADDDGASIGAGLRFGNTKFSADIAVSKTMLNPTSQSGVDDIRGWFKLTLKY